jgi:STE24 endopeptidase
MTSLGVFILIGLLAAAALEAWAEVLNLRALRPDPPPGFEDLYDREKYARSQSYTRARARFGLVEEGAALSALVGFWLFGGFGILDRWVPGGPLVQGLVFLGVLMAAKEALSLPFSVYGTFVIEERFGFNKTTPATFVKDRLKGYALALVIGAPLLAVVLSLFDRWGGGAWWIVWVVVTAVSLLLQFIAPTWILPLFNKFTPLAEGELRTAIFALAKKLDFPLTNVFVMDGSRRSAKGNAFFTGFGRNKRIALFDTLISKQSVPELVAVLAHEIGHHKRGHIWKGFALGVAQTGALLFLLSLTLRWPALFEAFGLERVSAHAGMAVFGILFAPISLALNFPLKAYSRKNEFEADRFAVDHLGAGGDLASALKKLSADSLANLTPHPFYVALHYTHPPLARRVARL